MSDDSGIRVESRWFTRGDARVCPYCNRLHNHTWLSEGTELPERLIDPWGAWVWDVEGGDHSRIHQSYDVDARCRCYVEYTVQVLWGGNWVDYAQVKHELENIRSLNQELTVGGVGGAPTTRGGVIGNFDPGWWPGDYGAAAGGGRAISPTIQMYRLAQMPSMARRFATGNIGPYDVLRTTRLLGRYAAPLASAMAFITPYAMALMVTEAIMTPIRQLEETQLRPATLSEAYRKRETDRERFRAWFP